MEKGGRWKEEVGTKKENGERMKVEGGKDEEEQEQRRIIEKGGRMGRRQEQKRKMEKGGRWKEEG